MHMTLDAMFLFNLKLFKDMYVPIMFYHMRGNGCHTHPCIASGFSWFSTVSKMENLEPSWPKPYFSFLTPLGVLFSTIMRVAISYWQHRWSPWTKEYACQDYYQNSKEYACRNTTNPEPHKQLSSVRLHWGIRTLGATVVQWDSVLESPTDLPLQKNEPTSNYSQGRLFPCTRMIIIVARAWP